MQKISVTSLVRYLKNKLDNDLNLQNLTLSGELSDFHRHFSGHLYFTLKDEKSQIKCIMFKTYASKIDFDPINGDKVECQVNTSIYEANGTLQLYVLSMKKEGVGDLYRQYELLKEKLTLQGYFNNEHKKILSKKYLENVAVLVGEKSAAMSDIKITFLRRWPLCNVDYYPVLVQGNDAPNDIIDKLKEVDSKNYDAIILARGGGSFEDLFCFNDENLVKTIYDLKTFIVTGVGHEQDTTLVDFVSDLRAATPTASVELITPNINDVSLNINLLENKLKQKIDNKINNNFLRLDLNVEKLAHYHLNLVNDIKLIDHKIEHLKDLLLNDINLKNNQIKTYENKIVSKVNLNLQNSKLTFKRLNTLLDAYNPLNSLEKGYSLIYQDGKIIKRKKDLKDKEFIIKFYDGDIQINEVNKNEF